MAVIEEGFKDVLGLKIYYKIARAQPEIAKLLTMHGGPGSSHDYHLPLADQADREIAVIFYGKISKKAPIPQGGDDVRGP
ncbi:MAG: hypothetical protein RAK24_04860 [TACK group archaeon]|nr:hypothetical protein [TACK group archaeon]